MLFYDYEGLSGISVIIGIFLLFMHTPIWEFPKIGDPNIVP